MITNDARCTRGIKSRIANAKAALNKKTLFTSKLDSNLRKKLVKCYIWSRAVQGAETWAFWETDQKYRENFEMWLRRGLEKIITQSHGGDEYPTYNKKMEGYGNCIGHILSWKCLLKYVTEGKILARI
jgi:predicted AlkP superfamily pyrophosphatase or phosphodiesterase